MVIFQIYCLFALTTAFTAMYELVNPVLRKQLKEKGKLEQYKTIQITIFILCLLIAPLVFLSCVVPEYGIRFRETLQKALFEIDQEIHP